MYIPEDKDEAQVSLEDKALNKLHKFTIYEMFYK